MDLEISEIGGRCGDCTGPAAGCDRGMCAGGTPSTCWLGANRALMMTGHFLFLSLDMPTFAPNRACRCNSLTRAAKMAGCGPGSDGARFCRGHMLHITEVATGNITTPTVRRKSTARESSQCAPCRLAQQSEGQAEGHPMCLLGKCCHQQGWCTPRFAFTERCMICASYIYDKG